MNIHNETRFRRRMINTSYSNRNTSAFDIASGNETKKPTLTRRQGVLLSNSNHPTYHTTAQV